MKYVLMMNVPAGGKYQMDSWAQQDVKAHLGYWKELNAGLAKSGELVAVEALADPGQAKRVRAGQDGKPITDGVFPEAKEFLAGYWIVDVDNSARAYEIAAQASAAPGPGGKPLNMDIEVREVMGILLRDVP